MISLDQIQNGGNMIEITIDNESHENVNKIYLTEEEAIEESIKKDCIVAYY